MFDLVYEHKNLCYVSSFANHEIVLMKVHIHADHSFCCFNNQLLCGAYVGKLSLYQCV